MPWAAFVAHVHQPLLATRSVEHAQERFVYIFSLWPQPDADYHKGVWFQRKVWAKVLLFVFLILCRFLDLSGSLRYTVPLFFVYAAEYTCLWPEYAAGEDYGMPTPEMQGSNPDSGLPWDSR